MIKRAPRLERYRPLVGDEVLSSIYRSAEVLAGLRVLHLNTTAQGGGVAELLHTLLPLMEELGIPHAWRVVPLDDACSRFTAQLVDLLQGMEQEPLPLAGQRKLLEALSHTPVMQQVEHYRADLYMVHDFQLVPLATIYPWLRPALWMCHVDTAHPERQGKAYLDPFLKAYRLCIFTTPLAVFQDLPPENVQVITPAIDPFSEKNRPLSPKTGRNLLAACGIDVRRPLLTQVSRFGNWKNPWQVLEIYRLVKRELPDVQVALVGALEAADDIRAIDIFKDVQKRVGIDPDIHLLCDPHHIKHPQVNAFQRYSSVILQRSVREGFGLTVTEAMWKYQPVIGTSATGLRAQILDGQNGFIADDTETCAQAALQLIHDRTLWHELGERAHKHVQKHFLLPLMIRAYLQALIKACDSLQCAR